MVNPRPMQLKAAFLLSVFALNTVVGFACAIGVNLGFNAKHHHEDKQNTSQTEQVTHLHADGKKHIHHDQKPKTEHSTSHHHDGLSKNSDSNEDSGNCCKDEVIKFEQLDKAIVHSYVVNPIFFITIASAYFIVDLLLHLPHRAVSIKYFVRSHHPPIPDIRVAIRSFQI
jgi:hypothetical protein